ncbi:MAG: sodium:alanine symporter family protein [Dysgonamonadaceae bacterium]|jgi:AGCS family alanine or glycine:cation symporter|nr:sodium:alanine symporter family protein [Dysgonamonadaceae bacterium]
MTQIPKFISDVAGFMWGWPLLILLLGTHLFLTVRLKFIQRYTGTAIRLSVKKDPNSKGEISQFSALATSLAATIGTGNIIGVATAVVMGGPGAVFWVWITGVFGIATKYGEGLLAVKYRKRNPDGSFSGGPMYALEYGLKSKFLAVLFAVFTAIAAFGIGAAVQANALASTLNESFGFNKLYIGIFLFFSIGLIIIGGLKSIARVCDKLVPFMAIFYVVGCVIILVLGYDTLLSSLGLIIKSAFTGHAATGGFAGSTIMMAARYGVARGLFSNESGLGSAPIVAATARTKNPVRQALVSSSGTFWDTVIICALTGLVLVNTGAWHSGKEGVQITQYAFETIFHKYGSYFLSISLVTFTFSTIIGWAYYAEKSVEYLWGAKSVLFYKLLYLLMVFAGTILSINIVWDLGDIFNGLMAIPNLIALLLLSGVIVSETKKYLWNGSLDDPDENHQD